MLVFLIRFQYKRGLPARIPREANASRELRFFQKSMPTCTHAHVYAYIYIRPERAFLLDTIHVVKWTLGQRQSKHGQSQMPQIPSKRITAKN